MGDPVYQLLFLLAIAIFLAIIIRIASKNPDERDTAFLNRWEAILKALEENHISSSALYTYPDSIPVCKIYFCVDEKNQAVYVSDDRPDFICIPFSEIIGYEVLVDNRVTNAVGRSLVGGALMGNTGAIVGAMTAKKQAVSFKFVIYRDNIQSPQLVMTLIHSKYESSQYQKAVDFASQVQATLNVVIHRNQVKQ